MVTVPLNQAFESYQMGDISKAEALCEKALSQSPHDTNTRHLYALIKKEKGDLKTAKSLMHSIYEQKKEDLQYLNNFAVILEALNEWGHAIRLLKSALNHNPLFFEAYQNLGNLYLKNREPERAIFYIQKALTINPEYLAAHMTLGNAYRQKKQYELAIKSYVNALSFSPNHGKAHHYIANTYKDIGDFHNAFFHYQTAERLMPSNIHLFNDFGRALRANGQPEQAIRYYQKAITLEPLKESSYIHLGNTCKEQFQFKAAEKCYIKAISLDPYNIKAHFNLAIVYLVRQNFEKGFEHYEWRLKWLDKEKGYPNRFGIKLWQGQSLKNKTLLIYDEQGFGDVFQFLRFIDLIKSKASTLIFETRESLIPLLRNHPKIDSVLDRSQNTPPSQWVDYCIPLASLPKYFIKKTDDIPTLSPYILADPQRINLWENKVEKKGFNIGLVWMGSHVDPNRSCPLSAFAPLSKIPGIRFYGLQVNESSSSAPTAPSFIQSNLGVHCSDFSDTAAMIHLLDLIISIDTASAHLAGAMGKPVWVILPYISDWRWFQKGEESPWYPTMRLFRQKKRSGWDTQIQTISERLGTITKAHKDQHSIENHPIIQKAEALCQKGFFEKAIEMLESELLTTPSSADCHNYLGDLYLQNKNPEKARFHYLKAIGLNPLLWSAHFHLGKIFKDDNKLSSAQRFFETTHHIHPFNSEALFNLGLIHQSINQLEKAAKNYKKVIALDPYFFYAYNNLGLIYHHQNRLTDAIQTFKKAIAIQPDFIKAYQNIGNVYLDFKKYDRVIAWYQKALKKESENPAALFHFGQLLNDYGKNDRAIKIFKKALEIDPERCSVHLSLAISLLRKKAFHMGWKHFEWRFQNQTHSFKTYPYHHFTPKWDGSPFNGKTILVHCEQGLGDTIQFARFLPLVKQRGGQVLFEIQPSLSPLFKSFEGVDTLLTLSPKEKTSVSFDVVIPLLSLPKVLSISPSDIEPLRPYLFADSKKVPLWKKKLNQKRLNVGLVWQGSPMHINDRLRSIPFQLFEKIRHIPGIRVIGFQKKGVPSSEKKRPSDPSFENWGEEFYDFSDTAAAIEAVDLIISVDTAVAHLAGAMGKKVFLLLPFVSDWRWFEKEKTTPWYPAMHLFRQPRRDDWDWVLSRVKKKMASLSKKVS